MLVKSCYDDYRSASQELLGLLARILGVSTGAIMMISQELLGR